MTREKALLKTKDYLTDLLPSEDYDEVEEIIKALSQEPCEDAISRQAVDELSKELVHTTRDKADFLCNFWEGLQKLPSVTPQAKDRAIEALEREPLTDTEQLIFLAAMRKEEKVCKEVCADGDGVDLVAVCHKIERKVKKALWG